MSASIINEVGGLELQRLNRGDRAIVELRVVSRTAIRHAQLSFEVRRSGGGPTLGGSRTQFALPTLEIRQGENIVRYEIDHNPLLIGTYEIGTELIDLQSRHIFDHCEQSLRFDVGPTSDSSQFGLFDLRGSWRVAP